MTDCPYCDPSEIKSTVATTDRMRHPHHTTRRCSSCGGYFVVHINGSIFPLIHRYDKNADTSQRVVDLP